MKRKTLTQTLPFLLPIRIWQRNLFFKISLYFDKNIYSKRIGDELKYEVCKTKTLMINENSGYNIIYQKNKVHNLKIISKTMNKILIYPNETFSFCYLLKNTKKYGKLKEGLISVNNKIITKKGGGLCHLSNLLYYSFLLTPLTIVERHGHKVKSLPNPDQNSLEGVDATINSGWLDLKVRNDTKNIYQIIIDFDQDYMYVKILCNKDLNFYSTIINDNFEYIKKNDKIYESVSVIKLTKDKKTDRIVKKQKLYDEVVLINYELPKNVRIRKLND